MVSAVVVDSGGDVEEGKEEVEEEGGRVSEVEAALDDNLPEEVVDAGAVVGEEEAAVVVSSSVDVDVPEVVVEEEDSGAEVGVVLWASVVLAGPVVEPGVVVVWSADVVRPAVVDAGAVDEEEPAVVDSGAELLGGSPVDACVR